MPWVVLLKVVLRGENSTKVFHIIPLLLMGLLCPVRFRMKSEVIFLTLLGGLASLSDGKIIQDCRPNLPGLTVKFNDVQNGSENQKQELLFRVTWWNLETFISSNSNETYWIGIWLKNPKTDLVRPVKKLYPKKSSGNYLVKISILKKLQSILMQQNLSTIPKCLFIWTAFVAGEKTRIHSCLETNPFWMSQLWNETHKKLLPEIVIPGVYQMNNNKNIHPSPLSFCHKLFPWCELVFGVRFFQILIENDFRLPALYFININGHQLSFIKFLNVIRTFLTKTREFVITEIALLRNNSSFTKEVEGLILMTLGEFLMTQNMIINLNIGELKKKNKRAFFSSEQLKRKNFINKKLNFVTYRTFSENTVSNVVKRNELWIAKVGIPEKENSKYSHGENEIEANFLFDFKNHLWKYLNIVAFHCILCNDFVELAKQTNRIRAVCPEYRISKLLLSDFFPKSSRRGYSLEISDTCETNQNFETEVKIWSTISSQPRKINNELRFRLIQVNWSVCKLFPGDTIVLFEENPSTKSLMELKKSQWKINNITEALSLFIYKPNDFEGIITTNISLKRPSTSSLSKGECFGAWIMFVRKNKIIKQTCFSSKPKWIWNNKLVLGDNPLSDLILPGTHNSGSYLTEDSIDVLSTWIVCQDVSILHQLLLGIRYLDLRIGYYPETEELLWINHDMVRWTPLNKVLQDVRSFSFLSPDPIIIDIHRTPIGFENEEAALLLISLLNETLGEYLSLNNLGYNITAKDLWRSGKTIIVSFGSQILRNEVPWLWPPIIQAWANSNNVKDLKSYLEKEMKKNKGSGKIWVAMGHLTPTTWDLIFKADEGLRGWADKTGQSLSDWLKYNWSQDANIIAVDFFMSSNIIDLSIRLSLRKELCDAKPEEKCVMKK